MGKGLVLFICSISLGMVENTTLALDDIQRESNTSSAIKRMREERCDWFACLSYCRKSNDIIVPTVQIEHWYEKKTIWMVVGSVLACLATLTFVIALIIILVQIIGIMYRFAKTESSK